MLGKRPECDIPLPKGWPRRVRFAVIHTIRCGSVRRPRPFWMHRVYRPVSVLGCLLTRRGASGRAGLYARRGGDADGPGVPRRPRVRGHAVRDRGAGGRGAGRPPRIRSRCAARSNHRGPDLARCPSSGSSRAVQGLSPSDAADPREATRVQSGAGGEHGAMACMLGAWPSPCVPQTAPFQT